MPIPPLLNVTIDKIDGCADIESLRHDWETLLQSWGTPSFFLSWLWIGNWIDILTPDVCLYRITVYRNNRQEALALLTSSLIRRKGIFSSHTLALNESSTPGFDMMIEYNGLIGNILDRDIYELMLSGLIDQLDGWDELQLSAVTDQNIFLEESFLNEQKISQKLIRESYARFVDLKRLREIHSSFINSLSKKTRYKIRRYINSIEEAGAIQIHVADSINQALIFFGELKTLHQPYWRGRGQQGSFYNPVWVAFHKNVIRSGFSSGGVQLIKVTVDSKTIGVIYSVVSERKVYMMQSGYNYQEFPDRHPGYVCLAKVIEHNLDAGNIVFDFLAGDAQYKKSLATDSVKLKWVMLQRCKIKFRIENILRDLKHKMQGDSNLSF